MKFTARAIFGDRDMSLSEFAPTYMSLDVDGDVTVAKFVVEQLNDEENIELLGHELFALVDQFGRQQVVLDLSQVKYVTSSVIGKVITLHRKMHRNDGTLVLCELRPAVAEILRTSKLIEYFTVVDSLDTALASFKE